MVGVKKQSLHVESLEKKTTFKLSKPAISRGTFTCVKREITILLLRLPGHLLGNSTGYIHHTETESIKAIKR